MKLTHAVTILLLTLFGQVHAQGLINQSLNGNPNVGCGSFDFMEDMDAKSHGYMRLSNQYMENLKSVVEHKSNLRSHDVLRVPVVFHVVYNKPEANLPDSVLLDQIAVLNANFNRTISDTSNLRPDFDSLVGAANIEFYLATKDPDGNPSTGITRTPTAITHFGGVLPYASNQTALIQKWVTDSLMYNLFRISQDSLGGKSAWNLKEYMNIWIGDLRILEPQVNNFEELVFFGLSTPPSNHASWPDSLVQTLPSYTDGTLMHFVNIGSNNPNQFMGPYAVYNGLSNTGKMLVHEAGHYLGLRHIWGDGDCTFDDFIHDTPRANAASQYNCNPTLNSCVDTINGLDLPNMIENYMDYSSASCQNAFTIGQVNIMRAVLDNQRLDLVVNSVAENGFQNEIKLYPNPTHGGLNLQLSQSYPSVVVNVLDMQGRLVSQKKYANTTSIALEMEGPVGIYFVRVISENNTAIFKVVKQ